MIRPATLDDMSALLDMAHRFAEEAQLPAPICPASMGATFCNLIENGVLLTDGKHCAAGALIYPAFFNASYTLASEFFWWVEREARGSLGPMLLTALEEECRDRGAHSLTMMTLETVRPVAVGRLYERRGYRPQEHHYIKHFEG